MYGVGFTTILSVLVSLLLQMDRVLCWFDCYTECTGFTVAADGWSIVLVFTVTRTVLVLLLL